MPKLSDMMPSKYLKHTDCDDSDLHLTMTHVAQESIGQGKEAEQKWILYFSETEKGLVLNKTNMKAIGDLHGDDTDEWEGKRIALFATEVSFGTEMVMAVRVRKKAPKAKSMKGEKPANGAAPAEEKAAILQSTDDNPESDVPY